MSRVVAVIAGIYGLLYLLPAVLMEVLPYLPRTVGVGIFRVMPRPPGSLMQAVAQMSLGAVLLAFAYRRWHTSPRKTAQYTRHDEGESSRFEVVPATAPISVPVVLLALALAVGSISGGIWIFSLFFVAVLALLLLVDNRGGSAGRTRTFRVSKEGIEIDDQWLRRDDLHHLSIRNKFAGDVEVVYDANRGIPTGRLLGLGLRQKLAAVACRVEVESGGKAHVVAAGLDEVTARGLVAEIGKRLDLRA